MARVPVHYEDTARHNNAEQFDKAVEEQVAVEADQVKPCDDQYTDACGDDGSTKEGGWSFQIHFHSFAPIKIGRFIRRSLE